MRVFVASDDAWISAPPDNTQEVAVIPLCHRAAYERLAKAAAAFPRAAIVALVGAGAQLSNLDCRRAGAHATAALGISEEDLRAVLEIAVARRAAEDARVAREIANRDEAISVMSHELRNPLNVIAMTLAFVAEARELTADKRETHMKKVDRAVQRMTMLLEDVTELSRLEAGTLTLELQPVATSVLLDETVSAARAFADERGVTIVASAEDAAGVELLVDRGRALKALATVVQRVVAAVPRASSVVVRAEARADTSAVTFEIAGSGRAPLGRGTAFSLAIAARLIEAHGGRAWTKDDLEHSSTLRLTLPRA